MSDTSIYYKNNRNEMTSFLPKQYSRVLEIGCGEGNFRKELRKELEYWGVEPVESVALTASRTLDKVLIGSYQEMLDQIPRNYFDLVICNDVIEHMVDHNEFFQSIKERIKPGGCLVASIPNVRYLPNLFEILVEKDWRYKDEGILDRTHLRFFTKKSLLRAIADNGFAIDQCRGINPYHAHGGLRRLVCWFAILILGQDVRFLQFAIRIRRVESSNQSLQPTS